MPCARTACRTSRSPRSMASITLRRYTISCAAMDSQYANTVETIRQVGHTAVSDKRVLVKTRVKSCRPPRMHNDCFGRSWNGCGEAWTVYIGVKNTGRTDAL